MRYCSTCLLPDTKPDLKLGEDGVCSACSNFSKRQEVDWDARKRDFEILIDRHRSANKSGYDCVIPVSGGKDSTYQVIKVLELGLRPLAVTATTCDLSPIGERNIKNIRELGVDHLTFSPNPVVRRKLNRIGLEQVGDIAWPEHVGIFTVPVRVATQFQIPLIVWGENSQNEYGGPEEAAASHRLDRRWLEEFGGLLGLRVSDLPGNSGLSVQDLLPYNYPTADELESSRIEGVFLGHFFPWDGLSNALLAQANGFESFGKTVEGSMVDYENLDNFQHGIHDYFKFLKFGFGRATDIASMHIRRGRISRSQAIAIVRKNEGKFPWSYLDKPLQEILQPLDLSVEAFRKICDKFTNKKLFKTDAEGNLLRDPLGNLEKTYYPSD